MRRPYVIGLIGLALVLFLVVSALLARAFSVTGAENSAITDLVRAEAAGNANGVTSLISGCSADARCRARAAANASALRRPGGVSIIQILGSSGFSLTGTVGTARVAWLVGSSLPRVQCLRVRHDGDLLQGYKVELLEVSARIKTDHACPRRF